MPTLKRSRSERFLSTWPAIARGTGLLIGLIEMGAGIFGRPVSAEVLAFAGALVVAPNIAGAQEKRNEKRQ